MLSSVWDVTNSRGVTMRRYLLIAVVVLASLTAGACAGRIRVATQPVHVVNAVASTATEPALLPVRSLSLGQLLIPPVLAAEPSPEPPACDLAAEALKADPELDSITPKVGVKDYAYIEVRGGVRKPFTDPEKEIALRVINKDSCEQQIIFITKRGDTLISPDGWKIEAVRRANGIRWNNWATQYRITGPEHWVVLRNRYPLVQGEGKRRRVTNITYSPYSGDLHLPLLVEAGRDYMTNLAQRALDRLRTLKVPSRAMKGVLLADTPIARPEVSARLGPIEHMDFGEFVLDPVWSMEHAFIRIALNGDGFAQFTCSKASACGLMQFTDNALRDTKGVLHAGTYTTLRRNYPAAKLNPNFEEGARDPLNAMIASYLHHDNALRYLIKRFGPSITDHQQLLDELVGGIYNGGETYTGDAYAASLKKKVSDWTQALKTCRLKPYVNCIPGETVGYVTKLRELIAVEKGRADTRAQAFLSLPLTR